MTNFRIGDTPCVPVTVENGLNGSVHLCIAGYGVATVTQNGVLSLQYFYHSSTMGKAMTKAGVLFETVRGGTMSIIKVEK